MSRRQKGSHGAGTIADRGVSWRFELYFEGQYRRESFKKSEFASIARRNAAFEQWKAKVRAGRDEAAQTAVLMSDQFDRYLIELARRQRRVDIEKGRIEKHLRPKLGALHASRFNLGDVDDYIDERKQETTRTGAFTSNATINRELAIITRSLRLMRPEPRLLLIEKLDEKDGIRQGTVSAEEYQLFLRELEDYQKPLWVFSYYTGVRQGQLLKFRREWTAGWESSGVIDVPGRFRGERITKNGKPHHIPLYAAAMREMLKWALSTGDPACPYLFQRAGKPISRYTFHDAFKRVAVRLGRESVLFHDLRRTAVTNMIEAGIPPEKAKDISGHLTMSVFERYNIVTAAKARASVKATGAVMAAWHASKFLPDSPNIHPENPDGLGENFPQAGKPN